MFSINIVLTVAKEFKSFLFILATKSPIDNIHKMTSLDNGSEDLNNHLNSQNGTTQDSETLRNVGITALKQTEKAIDEVQSGDIKSQNGDARSENKDADDIVYRHRVFIYGTLKRGQPNEYRMYQKEHGNIRFVGMGRTKEKWPLIIGTKFNIPLLMYAQGRGKVSSD